MPVLRMQKVALLAHQSVREDVLNFLHDAGVLEISPNEETVDIEHPTVSYEKAEVLFAINFLQPVATKAAKSALKNPGSTQQIIHAALHTDFRSIIDACTALEDRRDNLQKDKQEILQRKAILLPWQASPFLLEQHETKMTVLRYGTLSALRFEEFQKRLQEQQIKVELVQLGVNNNRLHLAAIVWKNDMETFEEQAASAGFSAVELPIAPRTPTQELGRIEQELRVVEGKEKEIEKEHLQLATHFADLVRLMQYLHWIDQKQAVRSECVQTTETIMLTGWIAAREFATLAKKLEQNFPAVALFKIAPKEGEEPPVQIHNVNALAPFEAVTRLFGLPQSHEMDPTRPLLPFFILSFGLCLTDAGYGITLALLMGLLIWKLKLKRQQAKLVWLLFYAGIVTFFVSIPFGGWFGMTPDSAPEFLTYVDGKGRTLFLGQLWDLQKDVDFFRNLALTIGGIQILFGIFLAGYWKWIHGKRWEAIASHFSLHLFVALLAGKYLLALPMMDPLLIATGALFVWGQGSGAWFVRPLVGALSTVSFLISLMSNILSYLRILALGLATGALAFAINQIAIVISSLLPAFLGIPVFIIILLGGHAVSIALNGLGSFVHSGRLQFIEFFGQFFQGGGREFNPFRRTLRSIG